MKKRTIIREPLKTGVKSKNGQGVPDSRKADEVRLYALRGGLTTKMARTAHFRSHEVFRGDHNKYRDCFVQPRYFLFAYHAAEFLLGDYRNSKLLRLCQLASCFLARQNVGSFFAD